MAIFNSIHSGLAIDSRLSLIGITVTENGAVGDGIADDRVAIQATIDAVSALGGGNVIVPRGTFRVTKATIDYCLSVTNDDVNIILSDGAIIKMADNQVTAITDRVYVVRFGDGVSVFDNMSILGDGTIDYNQANQSYTGQDGGVQAKGAVKFFGSNTNSSVANIAIINVNGDAIFCDGVSTVDRGKGLSISGTYINNCAEGILFRYINDVTCTENTVINTVGYITPQDAIEPLHCSNVIVNANIIDNVEGSGIDTDGCFNMVISNNVINDYASGGNAGDGITLSTKQANSSGISVIGNVVTGLLTSVAPSFGITTLQDVAFAVTDCVISGNTITTPLQAGIRVWISHNNINVTGNTIIDAGEQGFKLHGNNLLVSSNLVINCGKTGNTADQGLLLNDGTGCSITGNTFIDTQATATMGRGMQITNNSDSALISGNLIEGAGGVGIEINSGTHRVMNNVFKNFSRNETLKRGFYVRSTSLGGHTISGNSLENIAVTGDLLFYLHIESNDGLISNNKITDTTVDINPEAVRVTGDTNKFMGNDINSLIFNDTGTSNIALNNVLGSFTGASTTPVRQINLVGGTWTP